MQTTLGDVLGIDINNFKEEAKLPTNAKTNKCFGRILWAIKGPIIVMPSYTDMQIPENIKQKITIERLLLAGKQEDMASEAETMWYISTVSLCFPLDRDWYNIFMLLTRNFMLSMNKKMELPDFLQEEIKLEDMQKSDLKRLREWIFRQSFEHVHKKWKTNKKSKHL